MTSLEAYKLYLLKANKNDTNKNIGISKGEFVLFYNSQAPIWLDIKLEQCLSSDKINDIERAFRNRHKFRETRRY